MESNYIIQLDEKSFCPHCDSIVSLLCDKDGVPSKPSFYICWNCEFVGEVGKGEVWIVDSLVREKET